MKICSKCNIEKQTTEYYKHAGGKGGLTAACKECSKLAVRVNYDKNKARINAYNKEYALKNKDAIRARQKEYAANNKEKLRALNKKWHEENKEHVVLQRAAFYQENSDRLKAQTRAAYKANPERRKGDRSRNIERYRANERAYGKVRYQKLKNCENYKAACAARGMLYRIINLTKSDKKVSTENANGYTFAQFKAHIESQFDSSMSWANHGEVWHIDHIVPVMTLIKSGITEPDRINALDNLRPLCAHENMSKGDSFVLEPQEYARAFRI